MKYLVVAIAIYSNIVWALSFESGEYKNTMIELYTSQGCHNCPPAERWLGNFKQSESLFTNIVPMAFHVDYWDGYGWDDQYANPKHSLRHRLHYGEGNVSAVFTPHIVVSGAEENYWRDSIHHEYNKKVGNIVVTIEGDEVQVQFDKPGFVANIALLGSDIVTEITGGENAGRTAEHNFVVLGYDATHTKTNTAILTLPTTKKDAKLALAVWVSSKKSIRPIQVTGAWL